MGRSVEVLLGWMSLILVVAAAWGVHVDGARRLGAQQAEIEAALNGRWPRSLPPLLTGALDPALGAWTEGLHLAREGLPELALRTTPPTSDVDLAKLVEAQILDLAR